MSRLEVICSKFLGKFFTPPKRKVSGTLCRSENRRNYLSAMFMFPLKFNLFLLKCKLIGVKFKLIGVIKQLNIGHPENEVRMGLPFVLQEGHSRTTTRSIPERLISEEIEAFFANANLDTVAQSPYIGLIRAIERLEEGSQANGNGDLAREASGITGQPGPANPVGAPQVAPATPVPTNAPAIDVPTNAPAIDHFAASPLEPFSIHPLDPIPLALALALGLVIFFFFLVRKREDSQPC
jgi:hypothetical protein